MNTLIDPESCAQRDSAWTYVLGTTTELHAADFRAHLLEGCGACGAEVANARVVIAKLDLALASRTTERRHGAAPSSAIRARLLADLPAKAPSDFACFVQQLTDNSPPIPVLPGVFVTSQGPAGWNPTPAQGVEFKLLAEDRAMRRATALVRMGAGSVYPPHRHAGREECYVISGDLSFGDVRMQAGDYQVSEEGSIHPEQVTKDGCLLLVIASLDDEPV